MPGHPSSLGMGCRRQRDPEEVGPHRRTRLSRVFSIEPASWGLFSSSPGVGCHPALASSQHSRSVPGVKSLRCGSHVVSPVLGASTPCSLGSALTGAPSSGLRPLCCPPCSPSHPLKLAQPVCRGGGRTVFLAKDCKYSFLLF